MRVGWFCCLLGLANNGWLVLLLGLANKSWLVLVAFGTGAFACGFLFHHRFAVRPPSSEGCFLMFAWVGRFLVDLLKIDISRFLRCFYKKSHYFLYFTTKNLICLGGCDKIFIYYCSKGDFYDKFCLHRRAFWY